MISRTLPFHNGAITQTKMVLPAHWASILINGDKDYAQALAPEEQEALTALKEYGACVDCEDNASFAWYHDAVAHGVPADMCSTYTFVEVPAAHY